MRRIIILAPIVLAACTQDASLAQIDQKGHLLFAEGRTNQHQYVSYKPNTYAPPSLHQSPTNSFVQTQHAQQVHTDSLVHTSSVSSRDIGEVGDRKNINTYERWYQPAYGQHQPSNVSYNASSGHSFIPPVEARIVSGYGKKSNGSVNDGINYLIPAGEPVYASRSGKVAYTGDQLESYGNMVIVKHDNGYNSSYAHLGRMTVNKGDIVQQGQIIGYVGQSGNVERPQLHFAIRKGSEPVNPSTLISKL